MPIPVMQLRMRTNSFFVIQSSTNTANGGEENLHLKWLQLRQRPGQRRLDHVSVKGLLIVAWTVHIGNGDLFVDESTAKHVNHALVFLAEQCHCDKQAQISALLLSLEFSEAFQLRGLEQGDEHWLAHSVTLAPNQIFAANARELRGWLTVSLQVKMEIVAFKPLAELWGVERVEK